MASRVDRHSSSIKIEGRVIHEAALKVTSGIIGIIAGVIIGPRVMDYFSPMHPGEKLFYPLRDPIMSLTGAVLLGRTCIAIADVVARKVFGPRRPHVS